MRRLALHLTLAALALLALAPAAQAFGIKDLDVSFEDELGNPVTQAGAHPFQMTTRFALETVVVPGGAVDPDTNLPVDGEVPDGELKDLLVAQMPGFVGSQTAVERCSAEEFATRSEGYAACPDESAVGIAAIKAEFKTFPVGTEAFLHLPIYNLDNSDPFRPNTQATVLWVTPNADRPATNGTKSGGAYAAAEGDLGVFLP